MNNRRGYLLSPLKCASLKTTMNICTEREIRKAL